MIKCAASKSVYIISNVHILHCMKHFFKIPHRFAPSFVNYKKKVCTQLAATSDKVYQFLAHDRWFSPGTPASTTTKTGHHDIAEILLKVALNTINQIKSFVTREWW